MASLTVSRPEVGMEIGNAGNPALNIDEPKCHSQASPTLHVVQPVAAMISLACHARVPCLSGVTSRGGASQTGA